MSPRKNVTTGERNVYRRAEDDLYIVDIRFRRRGKTVRLVKAFPDFALAIEWRDEQEAERDHGD